jgi:hypothetical protein
LRFGGSRPKKLRRLWDTVHSHSYMITSNRHINEAFKCTVWTSLGL